MNNSAAGTQHRYILSTVPVKASDTQALSALHRTLMVIVLLLSVGLSGNHKACAQNAAVTGQVGDSATNDPLPSDSASVLDEPSEDERRVVDITLESPIVELDPVVVSASRHEENLLRAPASISIVRSEELAREGVPSVYGPGILSGTFGIPGQCRGGRPGG